MKATVRASQENMEADREELKANQEKIVAVAEHYNWAPRI
jgi:hypothetical protein